MNLDTLRNVIHGIFLVLGLEEVVEGIFQMLRADGVMYSIVRASGRLFHPSAHRTNGMYSC
jgi:hypothetical protein